MYDKMKVFQVAIILVVLFSSACSGAVNQTMQPTYTPFPTYTDYPTYTPSIPSPTFTPPPTNTPTLTNTIDPYFTPPTPTQYPTGTKSPTITRTTTKTVTPLPTNPLVDTLTLSNSLIHTPVVLLTAAPIPMLIGAAVHIPIIEYHYSEYNVDNQVMMTTDWFESQIGWLADNGFTTLSAADLIAYMNGGVFPQKSVILSFDLGTARRDNFINVIIPTLEKYKFTALFFLLVNDNVITDTCDNSGKFCWDDLRQWQQEGIASIESHGITHPDYATLTTAQMRWDAGQAFTMISSKLGTAPLGFAYPFDSIPSQAPKVIQSLGYQFAVGGNTRQDRIVEVMDADRYSLPRVYPYSNLAIYPIIGGSKGKTFDQMIMSLITGS